MIHIKEPEFWHYFFWTEHIQRFASDDAQHKESFYYYLRWLPVAIAPWTFLIPSAMKGFQKIHFQNPLIRYATCWSFFPLLFFNASEGKILTYILLCFPAISILLSVGLINCFDSSKEKSFQYGSYAISFLAAMLAIGLAVSQVMGCNEKLPYCHDSKWLMVVISLFISAILFFIAGATHDRHRKIILFMLAPMSIMFCAHFAMPDFVIPSRAPGAFLLSHQSKVFPDTIIVSDQKPFQAVCWFFKRNNLYLFENSGEVRYGIGYEDSKHRLLDMNGLQELIASKSGTILLIVSAQRYDKIEKFLPMPVESDSNGRIVMAWY
jgi:4-amino-4-deoxy-L-arabinose transferase